MRDLVALLLVWQGGKNLQVLVKNQEHDFYVG